MVTIALYRMHYGLDWIDASIASIIDRVDEVWVFVDPKPWGEVPEDFPANPEEVVGWTSLIRHPKIHTFQSRCTIPLNQFYQMCQIVRRSRIMPQSPNAIRWLCMEPDMIFPENLTRSLVSTQVRTWRQCELWKGYKYRVPARPRFGPVEYVGDVLPTGLGPLPQRQYYNEEPYVEEGEILNMGFCVNDRTMWYKQQCALSFSKQIGDSIPSETWYKEKWLNWEPETTNLEIAANYTHLIPKAEKVPDQVALETRQYIKKLKERAKEFYK